jgi:alpha-1,3-rhamnosyl/mannosyltransferase
MQPYAVHVGDLHVRRNLPTALAAVLSLRSSGFRLPPSREALRRTAVALAEAGQADGQTLTFVCAGIDRGAGEELLAQAAAAGDPGALLLTGPVSEDVLVNLYRGAAMLLYPSRYEGFGLPVLEAMGCGVPVIAANAASVPEIVGDAGILIEDPLDVPAWTDAIRRLLIDGSTAARLREAGLARAAGYSWARTAKDTIAVLRQCASQARKAGR